MHSRSSTYTSRCLCAKFVTHLFACLGQLLSLSGSLLVALSHHFGMSSPHLHLEVRTYLHPYPPWVCEYLDLSYSLCLLTICIDCCSRAYAPNSSSIYSLAWNNCHLRLATSPPPPHLNSIQTRKPNTIHSWKTRLRGARPCSRRA